MKPLLQFWNEQYSVPWPLEADSWDRRLLNRYVVAALMNTFPVTATKVFARSRGELARLLFVEREGGSFRVLRTMYEYTDPARRGDWLNRLLMQSPAVKAARNRRAIAQRMLEACLAAQPLGVPALVLAVGGGDGSLETEVIARAKGRDVYYCAVDKDERAASENHLVLRKHGLEGRGFVFLGNVAERGDLEEVLAKARQRFQVPFDGVSVAVCHGIAEYLDIGTQGNETLSRLLTALLACSRVEGRLIISQTDYHDRVAFLEKGLSWHMRLRSIDELATEVERAGWQISVCEHEPMKLISMCLAVKPDARHRRVDGNGRSQQFRARTSAAGRWRVWKRTRR
jgi:hypothetical protein